MFAMSLPQAFSSSTEYFDAVVKFLSEYRWLYYYPNTDILSANVLDCMPQDWCLYFEENAEQFAESSQCLNSPNVPESLIKYLRTIDLLTANYATSNFPKMHLDNIKGLGFKKQHEISLLAPLILKFCKENHIDYVVDIGCGLGYLTNLLHTNGVRIIGIDGNQKFVETAREKYPNIYFNHLYLTHNSAENVIGFLKVHFEEFNEKMHNVCLIALHACADLTIDILRLCVDRKCFKMATVMPCCYHRMKHKTKILNSGKEEKEFVNFPLSNELKGIVQTIENDNQQEVFLNGTFLRLACQRANWRKQTTKDREIQSNNLMFRNVLQYVVFNENLRVQRQRRKTGSHHADYTIDNFLTNFATSYVLTTEAIDEENLAGGVQFVGVAPAIYEHVAAEVRENYTRKFALKRALLAAFVALQARLQPICENLVLFDRCAFVGQSPDAHCSALKVTDECVSPRCFALLVTKSNSDQ